MKTISEKIYSDEYVGNVVYTLDEIKNNDYHAKGGFLTLPEAQNKAELYNNYQIWKCTWNKESETYFNDIESI